MTAKRAGGPPADGPQPARRSTARKRAGTPADRTPSPATEPAPEPAPVDDVPPPVDEMPAPADDAPPPAVETDTADYVTFVIQGEVYAFPMESVEEIIRMPQVVRVPLGPPSLEGLANLRGRILPVVSLRSCCGLPEAEHDEATRVVVVDGGATLGFVVDRVASVTSVDPSRVEPAESIGGAISSDLLAGVIKSDQPGGELTKVLDVAALVGGQFALLAERAVVTGTGAAGPAAGAALAEESDTDADGEGDTLELVSFAVDGQEYALPIDLVQEIVQAPERVTTVPNAEDRVLGVMDLRGRLLPVVSLRQVFGLQQAPLEPQNRIVVVHLHDGSGVVGVVMDTVREVLRVPNELVAALPDFMARSSRSREVDSVCRLEQGKRLVSVLSVERMFAREELRTALREAAGVDPVAEVEEDTMAGTEPGDGSDTDEQLLVVFRLADEEFAVDVDAVQEIIRVPDTLIRVPKTLDFVEGLVNLRGAVLPVVDLRTRLGLGRGERDERQRIIVLLVGGVRTGFIVDSVTEVLPVSRQNLQPAPELSAEQAALISEVAHLQGSQRMLMMLESEQLLATEQIASLVPHQRSAEEWTAAVLEPAAG